MFLEFQNSFIPKVIKSSGSKIQVQFLFRIVSNREMLYRHGFLNLAVEYDISKIQGDCDTFNANGTHQIVGCVDGVNLLDENMIHGRRSSSR
jgi:hypothetical protein